MTVSLRLHLLYWFLPKQNIQFDFVIPDQNQLYGEGEYYKIVTKKRFPIDVNEDEKEYDKKVKLVLKKRVIGIDKLVNSANYKDPARPIYSSREPNKLSTIELIQKQSLSIDFKSNLKKRLLKIYDEKQ